MTIYGRIKWKVAFGRVGRRGKVELEKVLCHLKVVVS
jgi:hypothetical protein